MEVAVVMLICAYGLGCAPLPTPPLQACNIPTGLLHTGCLISWPAQHGSSCRPTSCNGLLTRQPLTSARAGRGSIPPHRLRHAHGAAHQHLRELPAHPAGHRLHHLARPAGHRRCAPAARSAVCNVALHLQHAAGPVSVSCLHVRTSTCGGCLLRDCTCWASSMQARHWWPGRAAPAARCRPVVTAPCARLSTYAASAHAQRAGPDLHAHTALLGTISAPHRPANRARARRRPALQRTACSSCSCPADASPSLCTGSV